MEVALSSINFTISDVLAWARTKPAGETYCYTSNGHCALAQFLRDTGRAAIPNVDPYSWRDEAGLLDSLDYERVLNAAVQTHWTNDDTFGALVVRLEILANRPDIVAAHDRADEGDLCFYSLFPAAIAAASSAEPTPSANSEWAGIDAYLPLDLVSA